MTIATRHALCAALLGVAGCASTPAPAPAAPPAALLAPTTGLPAAELSRFLDDAGAWVLLDARDAKGARIDALFAHGMAFKLQLHSRVDVQGGCNHLFGALGVSAGALQAGALASTRMACEPARMAADAEMARLLSGPLQVTANGPAPADMALTTRTGEVLAFRRVPLVR